MFLYSTFCQLEMFEAVPLVILLLSNWLCFSAQNNGCALTAIYFSLTSSGIELPQSVILKL